MFLVSILGLISSRVVSLGDRVNRVGIRIRSWKRIFRARFADRFGEKCGKVNVYEGTSI